MIRSTVRSAGLAILLTMNGCGIVASVSGSKTPGLTVAEAALQGGAGQIALQVSEGILQEAPNNTRAMEIKGDALSLLGDYDEAGAVFQALLAKDPDSVRANIGMGRIKLQKDPRAAEALFQKVLIKDPRNETALNNLGIARDLQGRHAEAQLTYRQLLAVDPNLDSAKVNMALSLAMSGQGPAAIELLRAEANQPGADTKIRHDFAIVLAMAGHRSEAEAVLTENMGTDQARQVLDRISGSHSRGDESSRTSRVALARQSDDDAPPDVVQVPEYPARTVRSASLPSTQFPSSPTGQAPILAPAHVNLAATPMVVRPLSDGDDAAPTSVMRPVSPVAAAMTYQRPLSSPLTDKNATSDTQPLAAPSEDTTTIAMPPVHQVQKPVTIPVRNETPDTGAVAAPPLPAMPQARDQAVALPTTEERIAPHVAAPPAQSVIPAPAASVVPAQTMTQAPPMSRIQPAPAQPATPIQPMAWAQPVMPVPPIPTAPPTTQARSVAPAASMRLVTTTTPVQVGPATKHTAPLVFASVQRDDQTGSTLIRDVPSVAVQFAATTSEDAAYAFWRNLVHRFPESLSSREPTVIRYERGTTVFWRVRTEGFGNVAQAQDLCARIRSGGQDCFVPRS